MAIILNIETSSKICSVALGKEGKSVFKKENDEGSRHAAVLGGFVEEALDFAKENGMNPDAVAVSSGPGSYTGLRIGVSESKGLCFGLGIPLIAVSPLKTMANKIISRGENRGNFFCPMLDARRMEVYSEVYDKNMNVVKKVSADIITKDSYKNFIEKGNLVIFGDGASKCRNVLGSEKIVFIEGINPLAEDMAVLAEDLYRNRQFEDLAYFEPFYLKDFIATVSKNKVLY